MTWRCGTHDKTTQNLRVGGNVYLCSTGTWAWIPPKNLMANKPPVKRPPQVYKNFFFRQTDWLQKSGRGERDAHSSGVLLVALASHASPAMGDPDHYSGRFSFPGAAGSFSDSIGPGEVEEVFACYLDCDCCCGMCCFAPAEALLCRCMHSRSHITYQQAKGSKPILA
jgi:hypothetical protein